MKRKPADRSNCGLMRGRPNLRLRLLSCAVLVPCEKELLLQ